MYVSVYILTRYYVDIMYTGVGQKAAHDFRKEVWLGTRCSTRFPGQVTRNSAICSSMVPATGYSLDVTRPGDASKILARLHFAPHYNVSLCSPLLTASHTFGPYLGCRSSKLD